MPKGTQLNVYVPKDKVRELDAIATAMGDGEIAVRPTRSQLVTKAIENFVTTCQRREDLRHAIEAVRTNMEAEETKSFPRDKNKQRLRVIPSAS
jgi:hypothetical protein